MLFFGDNNQGLFLLAPIAILSLFGLRSLWRYSRRSFLLLIGLFTIMLLVISKSTTFNPLTNDGRYLTPFVGLWLVPMAFWIDTIAEKRQSERSFSVKRIALYGLLFLSIRNQLLHIAFSWNYDLDLSRLARMAMPPQNVSYLLKTVFPSAGNLPMLWLIELMIGSTLWVIWQWYRHQQNKKIIQAAM